MDDFWEKDSISAMRCDGRWDFILFEKGLRDRFSLEWFELEWTYKTVISIDVHIFSIMKAVFI